AICLLWVRRKAAPIMTDHPHEHEQRPPTALSEPRPVESLGEVLARLDVAEQARRHLAERDAEHRRVALAHPLQVQP
ncbi:MAG: hypothetical protein VB093_17545, partial [Propionicimonas sp.]|nr:hypothetical protein [Propionicimonas sp.]